MIFLSEILFQKIKRFFMNYVILKDSSGRLIKVPQGVYDSFMKKDTSLVKCGVEQVDESLILHNKRIYPPKKDVATKDKKKELPDKEEKNYNISEESLELLAGRIGEIIGNKISEKISNLTIIQSKPKSDSEIKLKTDYVPQLEDESHGLKHNLIPEEEEKDYDIEETLNKLKDI
jgi:hypothetical protein